MLQVTTVKHLLDHSKYRYELVDNRKNNPAKFLYAKNWQSK